MSDTNIALIQMIRDSKDPEQALITATLVILDFLKQHESSEERAVVYPLALC